MVQRRSLEGLLGHPQGGDGTRKEKEWSRERAKAEQQISPFGKSVIYILKPIPIEI